MTNGGLGVAFFLPWRPILVSPIGVGRFFSERGFAVLQSELVWIWLPAGLFAALMWFWRRSTNTA
jgi:inner membrane protein